MTLPTVQIWGWCQWMKDKGLHKHNSCVFWCWIENTWKITPPSCLESMKLTSGAPWPAAFLVAGRPFFTHVLLRAICQEPVQSLQAHVREDLLKIFILTQN